MSYSSAALGAVQVGVAAKGDPVLARASLEASRIILGATKKPPGVRAKFVANRLNAIRPGLAREAVSSRRRLVTKGESPDQATFDAMRLAIANATMDEGIQSLRAQAARRFGAEAFSGLGQIAANDRATGCAIASTASTVGGIANVIPVYGQIVGAVVGIGSGIASGALDCTRESREAAAATQQAQANLAAAQQAAATAAESARRTRLLLIGGGAIVALAAGYILLS